MITNLFGGSSTELVMHALGNHKASPEELEEIQTTAEQPEKAITHAWLFYPSDCTWMVPAE